MTSIKPKRKSEDYRCQDCGMVVEVKTVNQTTQHGELMCCNEPMTKKIDWAWRINVADAERNRLLKKCAKLGISEDQAVAAAIKDFIKKPS